MDYIDVYAVSDLPEAPEGYRYFDFIGGEKELRCFIVPDTLSRGIFMAENSALLGDALQPIYHHNGICVAQDASSAMPGFYIVHPVQHYRSLDDMPELLHLRLSFIIREMRQAMRDVLGVETCHVLYEEKPAKNKSSHVHYWMLPLYESENKPRLYNFNIREYMNGFSFVENKEKILHFNQKMRMHFESIALTEKDDSLVKKLNK